MKFVVKVLIIILLISTSILSNSQNSDHFRKIDIESIKLSTMHNFSTLIISATYDYYGCISGLISKSKFLNNMNVRSLAIDITRARGNNNIKSYESIVAEKIKEGDYKFIIIVDEVNLFTDEFIDYLKTKYIKHIIIIGHTESDNIYLIPNFNNFFQMLKLLDKHSSYNIYYVHNNINSVMDRLFLSLLKSVTSATLSINDVPIIYNSELTNLVNRLKSNSNSVIVSNLHYIINEVDGNLLKHLEISKIFNKIIKPTTLIISHSTCGHFVDSTFSLSWELDQITDTIDTFIFNIRNNLPITNYVLSTQLNLNLVLNASILGSITTNDLYTILDSVDNVIYGHE
jgi:hypothetical protein